MDKAYAYDTVIGKLLITEDGKGITGVILMKDKEAVIGPDAPGYAYELCETDLIREAAVQLKEYFAGERKEFDMKLHPKGTPFQMKVWEALRQIPYGETRSYKQIGAAIGNEKASRAVGGANHNNPILCMIPCHRVIGAGGALVGFGAGLNIKEQLLELERKNNTAT